MTATGEDEADYTRDPLIPHERAMTRLELTRYDLAFWRALSVALGIALVLVVLL